jgi:hypothetical protein
MLDKTMRSFRFVVWDMATPGLRPLMQLLAERDAYEVPGLDRAGGDLTRRVLHEGVLAADEILAFADLPNANVGYELGYALGTSKKPVALLHTNKRTRPAWLRFPPLAGFICESAGTLEEILSLPPEAFTTGPMWVPSGDGTLLLCPGGLEGGALKHKTRELHPDWKELTPDGWNLSSIAAQLSAISRVIWIVCCHSEGVDARDGSENARNAVVAGFAEARGAALHVLISREARSLADQEGRARYFSDLDSFTEALSASLGSTAKHQDEPNDSRRLRGQINFAPLLDKASQDFVGRTWLAGRIDGFLQTADRGYVIVEGLPGMGKTAFASYLVRERRWPHHFNAVRYGVVTFSQFLVNLRAQLIYHHGLRLPEPGPSDLSHGLFLDALLHDASRQLAATGTRVTVVVDGLDEAEVTNPGAQPLFLPVTLPSSIRMVVLTRVRSSAGLQTDEPVLRVSIEPNAEENRADVRVFLERMAKGALEPLLVAQKVSVDGFVDRMAEASQGNFMYLRAVVNDILSDNRVVSDLRALPRGLADYYERHWSRIVAQSSHDAAGGKLLYGTLCILSVAERPLTLTEMLAILQVGFPEIGTLSPLRILACLQLWGQFLVREPGPNGDRYQLYHKSFQEFLSEKPEVSGELQRREAHGWIATAVMNEHLK